MPLKNSAASAYSDGQFRILESGVLFSLVYNQNISQLGSPITLRSIGHISALMEVSI